jgi:hypothetical protein
LKRDAKNNGEEGIKRKEKTKQKSKRLLKKQIFRKEKGRLGSYTLLEQMYRDFVICECAGRQLILT